MKTLAATVPRKTERMGRYFLRDTLLQRLASGANGVGWEIHPTHADQLTFRSNSDERKRWIDYEDNDEFRRELAEDWPEVSPDAVDELLAARKRLADTLVSEVLQLIGAPLGDGKSTTGQFLFQFGDDGIPVSVAYQRDGDYQRLELHFTATREHRESAHRVSAWRRENPSHTAPISPDESPELLRVEPSLLRHLLQLAIPIVIWSLAMVLAVVTAFEYPLSSLFAFVWGLTVVPLYFFVVLHRYAVRPGKKIGRAFLWKFGLSFLGVLLVPVIICGFALWPSDAGTLFITTTAGLFVVGFVLFLWRRDQRAPEMEPL